LGEGEIPVAADARELDGDPLAVATGEGIVGGGEPLVVRATQREEIDRIRDGDPEFRGEGIFTAGEEQDGDDQGRECPHNATRFHGWILENYVKHYFQCQRLSRLGPAHEAR